MNKKYWVIFIGVSGIFSWFFPAYNGLLFESSDVTIGEGRIIGVILIVGALLLWYLPEKK